MIYLTAQERDYARLFRLDPATKTFTRIDTGIDMFGSLRLAADAAVAVGLGTSPWQPETLVRHAALAENVGFDGVLVSEHFHPWVDDHGSSGFAFSSTL